MRARFTLAATQKSEPNRQLPSCDQCTNNRFRNNDCLVDGHPCMREVLPEQVIDWLSNVPAYKNGGMGTDDDPLLPAHWLRELGDGLSEPLLRKLWNSPVPEPVASAPANANLTVRWSPSQTPSLWCHRLRCAWGGACIRYCRWPS